MHQNKVVLDFDKKRVVVNGVAIPATAVEIGDNDGRLRRTKRPTVEDVVEVVQAVDSLPSSVGALLMTEEEYQATLLEGEKVGPPTEKVEKILDKKKKILVEKTEKLEEKGTAGVQFTPAQELKSSSKQNKVQVKDDKSFTETKSPEGTSGPRVLRDRPIPPPVKWNEMVAALHAREEDKWSSRTRNAYRNATDDEISELSEFEYSPTGTVTRLKVVDDTDVHLRALRE
ncbi:hypothetical protein H0H92_014350, partial [Tricholoma furcatifolium]